MTQEQRVINELLKEIREIQETTTANLGKGLGFKIDLMCYQTLKKYEQFEVKENKLDDLGRVMIPEELRRKLNFKEGDSLVTSIIDNKLVIESDLNK